VASNLLIFLRINWPQCVTDSTPLNLGLPNGSDVALRIDRILSFRFIIHLSFHAWFSTTFHSVYVLVSFSVVNCYYFAYIVYLMRIKIVTNLWWRYLSMQSLGGSSNSFHFFSFRCKVQNEFSFVLMRFVHSFHFEWKIDLTVVYADFGTPQLRYCSFIQYGHNHYQ